MYCLIYQWCAPFVASHSWRTIVLNAILLVFWMHISCAQNTVDPEQLQNADDYLIGQFKVKDVIFLGEIHRIRENVDFAGKMIPVLHKNGIHLLFSEFARFKDTKRIDSLITAKVFDKNLALCIMFDNAWDWGYKEYVDLYYSAWKTNQSLKPNEKPFRIIGIEQYDNEGTGIYDQEQFWTYLIDSIGIKKGEKVLVYCGMHHAFTNFHQPYLVNDTLKGFVSTRVGNWVYKKYPTKTITVLLHGPWYGSNYSKTVLPCNGKIDSLVNSLMNHTESIGFSTANPRFDDYSLNNSLYGLGNTNARLKDLCQGYIVVKPICELNPVTVIPDFINKSNIDETIKKAEFGSLTPKAFNDSISSWLFEYSTKSLNMLKKQFCR